MRHTSKIPPLLFFLFFLLFSNQIFATSPAVYYTYDNTGNRIGRIIITEEQNVPSRSARKDNPDTTESTEDVSENVIQSEQLSNTDIKVYPNPTAGILHIKINPTANNLRYILYGNNGETLFYGQFTNQTEMLLDISNYSRSVYYLTLFDDTEKRIWKIIKQ
jgi:hypothetical protein